MTHSTRALIVGVESATITLGEISMTDKLYKDADWMRKAYCDLDKSTYEIADFLGCHQETVRKWIHEHDIPMDGVGRPSEDADGGVYRVENDKGYVQYHIYDSSQQKAEVVYEHQLVMLGEGAEPEKVFSNNKYETHHKNENPRDNRASNLELLTNREHKMRHRGALPADD